ncbi:nuclear transport factor 2 family protein [Anaerocolumna sedimenticola]|uniref:Nuclear transport factor 2 family protein n=1 Tax=Anaerocolumna sedimenticola TaxID=2696063 RepID=A0A6P1TH02_9FIRM|nr:nuclear transport factor 2 family protein [Anaerocolumna sedimenticola]QHQ60500.1 nuclear transport factor 2 family protein [Anaerocolumna sedimenticola]
MDLKEIVKCIFRVTIQQNAGMMEAFFTETAVINWHNTNESFSRDEYIRANCEYPGEWKGDIERIEQIANLVILVGSVKSMDKGIVSHVTSFYVFENGKVIKLDEYWGDDGEAPGWRRDMKIGRPIN